MAFRLHRKENAGHGLLRCVLEQLDAGARALSESDGEPSDVAVHDTRKRLKKCRAVLRLLRGGEGGGASNECNLLLRDAGRSLSRTRDARVALATLRRLSPAPGPRELAPLRRTLAKNAAAHEGAAGPVKKSIGLIRDAGAKLPAFSGLDLGENELAAGLAWLYKRARAAQGRWRSCGDPAHLHDWRKRAKDLCHALQVARRHCNSSAERTTQRLRELGKIAGHRLDLEVLLRVAAACADSVPSVLIEMVGAERRRLDLLVKKAAHGFFDEKPADFRRKILR